MPLRTYLRELAAIAAGSAVDLVGTLEIVAVFDLALGFAALADVPKLLDQDSVVVSVEHLKGTGILCHLVFSFRLVEDGGSFSWVRV